MSIENRFAVMLAEKGAKEKRRIPVSEVARASGITPKTLQGWANNTVTRFDVPVLEALCRYFNCQPGDLLKYEERK